MYHEQIDYASLYHHFVRRTAITVIQPLHNPIPRRVSHVQPRPFTPLFEERALIRAAVTTRPFVHQSAPSLAEIWIVFPSSTHVHRARLINHNTAAALLYYKIQWIENVGIGTPRVSCNISVKTNDLLFPQIVHCMYESNCNNF